MCIRVLLLLSLYVSMSLFTRLALSTGWPRLIAWLKLQVIFCKRATNYRGLLRTMTYKDKASYGSLPPCIAVCLYVSVYASRPLSLSLSPSLSCSLILFSSPLSHSTGSFSPSHPPHTTHPSLRLVVNNSPLPLPSFPA